MLVVLAVVSMAQNGLYSAYAQRPNGWGVGDSLPSDTVLPQGVDSLPPDSLRDERAYLENLDSIRRQFDKERGGEKSVAVGERAKRGQV